MAFPPKSQREQLMTLVCVVALALAGVYWAYVHSPAAEELAVEATRVDSLEARNERARRESRSGSTAALRADAERASRELAVMRELVPTGNEVPALLEQVSTAARRTGLELAGVQPEPVVEGERFDTYRYRLTVSGGYHDVAQLLTNIGSLPRIVAPGHVTLATSTRATPGKGAPTGEAMIDTRFVIQTYVMRAGRPAGGAR